MARIAGGIFFYFLFYVICAWMNVFVCRWKQGEKMTCNSFVIGFYLVALAFSENGSNATLTRFTAFKFNSFDSLVSNPINPLPRFSTPLYGIDIVLLNFVTNLWFQLFFFSRLLFRNDNIPLYEQDDFCKFWTSFFITTDFDIPG